MSLGERLGLVGVIVALFGIAAVYLWPDKKWIGWLCLVAAGVLVVAWSTTEVKTKLGGTRLSLAYSLCLGGVFGGVVAWAIWGTISESPRTTKESTKSVKEPPPTQVPTLDKPPAETTKRSGPSFHSPKVVSLKERTQMLSREILEYLQTRKDNAPPHSGSFDTTILEKEWQIGMEYDRATLDGYSRNFGGRITYIKEELRAQGVDVTKYLANCAFVNNTIVARNCALGLGSAAQALEGTYTSATPAPRATAPITAPLKLPIEQQAKGIRQRIAYLKNAYNTNVLTTNALFEIRGDLR